MDLRAHVGKALKNHRVLEGGCYHNGIYTLIYGNMSKGTSVIVRYKSGKKKEILGVSKVLKVGHGNDCCERDGVLYITASGKSNTIYRVSAKTLKKMSSIKVTGCKGGFNGISCYGDGYILRKINSKKCYIVNKNFKYKGKITLSKTTKFGQGLTWYKGKLYRGFSIGQSKKNYIYVYNSKGKLLKKYHYNKKCELENVFIVDGKLKCGIYKKYKKKGKKHFEAYIKTLGKV